VTESDQSDVFLDGISSVRPVADIGEIPYLQLIHSVSFFVMFSWFKTIDSLVAAL